MATYSPGVTSAAAQAAGVEAAWLQAERQQETGYPAGNYTQSSPGCSGAYCWDTQSIWGAQAAAAGYGQYAGGPASAAPPAVQNAVAWSVMGPYVTRGQYAQAAELWNGGVPYSVPNPVLGSSANYASGVIAKFDAIRGGGTTASTGNSGTGNSGTGGIGNIPLFSTPLGGVGIPGGIVVRGVLLLVGVFLAFAAVKGIFGVGGSGGAGPKTLVVSAGRDVGHAAGAA